MYMHEQVQLRSAEVQCDDTRARTIRQGQRLGERCEFGWIMQCILTKDYYFFVGLQYSSSMYWYSSIGISYPGVPGGVFYHE